MKLTPAQVRTLKKVVAGDYACIATYAPATKLIDLGLATYKSEPYGRMALTATEEGKAEAAKHK